MFDTSSRARLMASGAFLALAAGSYAPRVAAQAAGCGGVAGAITCSGAITSEQIFTNETVDYVVSTTPGFSINTSANMGEYGVQARTRGLVFDDAYGGDITGNAVGFSSSSGEGGVSITTSGTISSVNDQAVEINVRGAGAGQSVTVEIGGATGALGGVFVGAYGAAIIGSASVDVAGDVSGGTRTGVTVTDTDGDIDVMVGGNVSGGAGVFARSSVGSTTIDVTGDVMATTSRGVYAFGYSMGLNTEAILLNVGGDITAATESVLAFSNDGAGDIRVTIKDATTTRTSGGFDAVKIVNKGSGAVDLQAGDISSGSGRGVTIEHGSTNGSTSITVGNVTAEREGILMRGRDDAYARISHGDITTNGVGVELVAYGHTPTRTVIVTNGVIESGGNDVRDKNGFATLILEEGGALTGNVLLGSNDDQVILSGGDMGPGLIDGGVGDDAYDRFSVSASSDVLGSNIVGFQKFDVVTRRRMKSYEGLPAPVVAQFAPDDTLTLEGEFSSAFVDAGGVMSSGDTLTINAGQGVALNGGRDIYGLFDVTTMSAEKIGRLDGGVLRTGGTPGASTITVNVTDPNGGVSGSGTIDMQNGAVGDRVVVNGDVALFAPAGDDFLRVDIDPIVAEGDLLTVRDDLYVTGNVDVNVVNITETGVSEHVVARTTGGVVTVASFDGGGLTASTESVAAEVEARAEGDEIIVQVTTDFTPPIEPPVEPPVDPTDPVDPVEPTDPPEPTFNDTGLSGNGFALGEYFNEVLDDPALADIRARALSATSILELEAIYAELGGADFHAPLFSSFQSGVGFGAGLFSCAVGEGQFAAIDEGQCGWTRIGATNFDRDGSPGNPGVNENVFSISAGGQIEYDENIRLGAGIGYETIDSDGDAGLSFDGDRIHAGVSAKYVDGPFVAGVSIGGGVTFGDTERPVGGATAEGDFEIFDFSAIARAAYLVDAGDGVYVKPQIQGGLTYVDRDGFTETGGGAANLQVASESKTYFHVSPSVEIGGNFEMEDGMTVRPYVRLGATILSEDDVDTTARFAASASPATFTTTVARDDVFGEVNAGVVVFSGEDVSLRAEYQGRFSDDTESHGGFLRVQIDF